MASQETRGRLAGRGDEMSNAILVEIGPGEHPLDGFVTVDCKGGSDYRRDWGLEQLPFDSNTVDLIYASHCLEHVEWTRTHFALSEAYRVLRPGGAIEIWVPDFAYLVACYLRGECGDEWRRWNPQGDPMAWLNGRIMAYGDTSNHHRSVFDFKYLSQCLFRAGFTKVDRIDKTERPRGYDHGSINLGVRAIK